MAIEPLNTDALNVQTLLQVLAEHTSHLYSTDSVAQWLTLAIAILVALYTRRRMLLKLNESGSASQGLRRMTYRALERILWPISMLIVLAFGRFIIQLWQ